ncbi:MAG TPA: hypothetical protein PKB14_13680 [Rubrivivax sp.]|nr:hypothetical protein [Rubrivivax sp.]
MSLRVLDEQRAASAEALCERIVPGCIRTGAVVFVDAMLAKMPVDARAGALEAIDMLSQADSLEALSAKAHAPGFALVRALAIQAYYSDFVAPGRPGPGAWAEIDFQPPRAVDLERDWSWLGIGESAR